MTIEEYWARLVTSGLIPDKAINVFARKHFILRHWIIFSPECEEFNSELGILMRLHINYDELSDFMHNGDKDLQLRKDGVDLVKLKWRKPTEEDIGKMCWCNFDDNRKEIIFCEYDEETHKFVEMNNYLYLLANHGQITPTKEDFEEVYK